MSKTTVTLIGDEFLVNARGRIVRLPRTTDVFDNDSDLRFVREQAVAFEGLPIEVPRGGLHSFAPRWKVQHSIAQ